MARPASGKKTRQLGWRLDARLVDNFERWCTRERKDKVLELEHLMSTALQAAGYDPSYVPSAPEETHLFVNDKNEPPAQPQARPSRIAPKKRGPR